MKVRIIAAVLMLLGLIAGSTSAATAAPAQLRAAVHTATTCCPANTEYSINFTRCDGTHGVSYYDSGSGVTEGERVLVRRMIGENHYSSFVVKSAFPPVVWVNIEWGSHPCNASLYNVYPKLYHVIDPAYGDYDPPEDGDAGGYDIDEYDCDGYVDYVKSGYQSYFVLAVHRMLVLETTMLVDGRYESHGTHSQVRIISWVAVWAHATAQLPGVC